MAITLRDSLQPLQLRDSAKYAPNQGLGADYLEAQDTNPISRGWTSTAEGLRASELLADANLAERNGDIGLSQALQQRAQDHMARAQTWAPTTQEFTDINGVGSAANWFGGAVGGGLRSMLAPAAGGMAGNLAGVAVGALTRNPALGARASALLGAGGAFVPGYDMAYEEAVGSSMMDPTIRQKNTAQQIHDTAQLTALPSAALDAIVPAGVARMAVGGVGKRMLGKTILKDAGEEFATEGLQNLVGQTGQNALRGDELTNYDYTSAFNDAMAGGVAGGGLSAGGAAIGTARDKLGQGTAAVVDTARDPLGKVIDKIYQRAEQQGVKQARDEINSAGTPSIEQVLRGLADDRFFDPVPKEMPDGEVSTSMREYADKWADKILSSKPRTFGPREESLRQAAAAYKSTGEWDKFRSVLQQNSRRSDQEAASESFVPSGAKASEMTPEGKELDALAKAWIDNEGKRYSHYFDDSDEAAGLGAKMFAWIKSDFGKKLTEDGSVHIPRAFIEALGNRAPSVIESAVTAARKEGWKIADAGDVIQTLRDYVSSNEGDVGFLKSAIRYTHEKNWSPKMIERMARELRKSGGQLGAEDYKWFKTQVVDAQEVLKHFRQPSKFYKADNKMGLKVDSSLAAAARDQDEKVGVTENDGDWASGVNESDPAVKRSYPKFEDDEFFDIRDVEQRAELEKKAAVATAKDAASTVNKAVYVGIVDRTIEKVSAERGKSVESLPKQTRDKITRDLVHEYFPTFERLSPEPKDVSEFAMKQYAKRKADYEVGLKRRANLLNQKIVTLAVDRIGMEKLGTQIEAKDVHMKNADPRDPKYGPHTGTLIFRTFTKDGKVGTRPFVTSTQMIIAKMFRASDSNGASSKRYEGTAQQMLQLLSDGITSVLQDSRFGGEGKAMKIGTLRDGSPMWFDGADIRKWPKNLVLFRDKEGNRYTLGEALRQEREQSERTLSFDFDPDDFDAGRNDRVREKKPWEMRNELKELLDGAVEKTVRAKIVQAIYAKDEGGKRNYEPSVFLWNELVESGVLKSAPFVTEIGSTRGNQIDEGQVGPDDLSAYDPEYIKRDARGDMLSSSTEYTAQSRIGRSQSVDPKDAEKFAPGTKATPDRAEDGGKATRREEARQKFIELLRGGMTTFVEGVRAMSNEEVVMFDGAYNEFKKQLSDYPHTIANGYFGGNVDAARMLVSRFKKNMEQIDAVISKQRSEVPNAKRRVERDAVETSRKAGQADPGGKEAGVASESGRIGAETESEPGSNKSERTTDRTVVGRVADGPADSGNLTKQDAWVMKVASLSMKDMQAYIKSLPFDKLGKASDALETFFPADNSNPFWQRNDLDNYTDAKSNVVFEAQELIRDRLSEVGGAKSSEQSTTSDAKLDPEQALKDIARILGKDYDAQVVADLGGKAGMWTPHGIKLAAAAPNGTQYHEALHELFAQLRTRGAENVAQIIERVATNPIIMRKLEQLLADHPKAVKQLKKPEEAAAFLFQFWDMGMINVGPETKNLFQTIKDWIANVLKDLHAFVNAGVRDKRLAEKASAEDRALVEKFFRDFASGAVADTESKDAVYDALRKSAEAHQKTIDELGQRAEGFWRGFGKYVVTSETMLNLYRDHPELKQIADKFHQMAGKSMRNQARDPSLMARGGFLEAAHGEAQTRLNAFERFLTQGKYDDKDMEIALQHLERGTTHPADQKISKLVDYIRDYYGEMYNYAVQSDVCRLDPTSDERWVPLQKRKNYFTQSWSIEALTKDHDGFVSTLLAKHADQLAYMAQQANAELAIWRKNPNAKVESPTAKAEIARAEDEFMESGKIIAKSEVNDITPEMIAEQIYTRLLNSTGLVDIQESEWSLGITPAAAAVNRRELDWLDKEAFSKYKSKDLIEIVTSYTRTMVKRAEYQKRFGYGGEVIADAMDTAFLREMGGQALVDKAKAGLEPAIKAWKKAKGAWMKDNPGVPFPEPYPTLRMVGADLHRAAVGADAANASMMEAEVKLRPAINAVRAMEGTLGNEISQSMRSINSWINTYQNVRLLPLALFTNLSDVIGITVQGGTLGDAWNAFAAGMREVRNTWMGKKGGDAATLRAEEWGVSDAGAMLDTLGQNYSSVYMSEKAREVNNKFFRIIGMEGWNRGVRITAAGVGERIIMDWAKNGVDFKKDGEQARFERLFGEGADPKSIKLDKDGNLDTTDAANRAAIQRFVQDAVMSSNPAVRATWMSDPRMATFAHLKNFAYAFHSVMLKGILAQAAQGNLRPALVAGLGFASISIAAGAVKEMLIPGDEPYWMQGGLDGYLEYGYGQANLGGVPQMWMESVTQFDPAKLAGPFWDQIQNTLSSPIPGIKFSANLSPFSGETEFEPLKDRKVAVELAKALPAGNLAGRAMESLVGE
jgi:hypothetical protein